MKLYKSVVVFAAALLLSACSFVTLTEEGKQVRVAGADEVSQCRELGKTVVNTLDKIAGMPRHAESKQEELNKLARNTAVEIGGDTVVPVTPIVDGKQTFAVYRCMPR